MVLKWVVVVVVSCFYKFISSCFSILLMFCYRLPVTSGLMHKVTLRLAWLILGWVTVFGWVYHLSI